MTIEEFERHKTTKRTITGNLTIAKARGGEIRRGCKERFLHPRCFCTRNGTDAAVLSRNRLRKDSTGDDEQSGRFSNLGRSSGVASLNRTARQRTVKPEGTSYPETVGPGEA